MDRKTRRKLRRQGFIIYTQRELEHARRFLNTLHSMNLKNRKVMQEGGRLVHYTMGNYHYRISYGTLQGALQKSISALTTKLNQDIFYPTMVQSDAVDE